jgi:hypothetical protein
MRVTFYETKPRCATEPCHYQRFRLPNFHRYRFQLSKAAEFADRLNDFSDGFAGCFLALSVRSRSETPRSFRCRRGQTSGAGAEPFPEFFSVPLGYLKLLFKTSDLFARFLELPQHCGELISHLRSI